MGQPTAPRLLALIGCGTFFSGTALLAQDCLGDYTVTATPMPVDGTYDCGQTVTFCLTVNTWNTTNANWLQGVVASFGPGWDMNTLVPGTPPGTIGGSGGTWGWYDSVTGTAPTNVVSEASQGYIVCHRSSAGQPVAFSARTG